MLKLDGKNAHIWISLILFACCLTLPGYYVGEAREPQLSLALLMAGWLGPLDLHFSWFANAFYLSALLKYSRPKTSLVLGLIALAFALSFLGYDKVIVSEAPTYAPIMAYGPGYLLWIASIGVFSVGQLSLAAYKSGRVTSVLVSGWLILVCILYSFHYFLGDNSQYSIEVRRNGIYEDKCHAAGQTIYKRADDAKGIFFDPNGGPDFKMNDSGVVESYSIGQLGIGKLNSGLLLFYEERKYQIPAAKPASRPEHIKYELGNGVVALGEEEKGEPAPDMKPDDEPKYVRYELGDHKGVEVESLSSEYTVITRPFDIPKELGINGAEILIKDLKDDTELAKTSYVFDRIDRKFCGHAPKGLFSTSEFINDVLNLTKKHPSSIRQ